MLDASEADPCIPGYRIVSPLGVGGMASVYLAVQESLDRHVALKVLAPALAADRQFAQRFLKEGQITARLNHPHLLTVFDIGQHGAIFYLAAEYLPGGTLGDRIEQGIGVAESLAVVCDVARGLHFAHAAGFVHRDVKPGNVMFRANGDAVLADFGVAKAMSGGTAVTTAGSWIGTPRYMSPEQINSAAVDGRSDLYSLGVMLFELLTGKLPYQAAEPLAVALMHLSHPLPQLPPALAWLQPSIDGLMAKDANARFASGEEFVAAVERLLAQTPEGMALGSALEAGQRAAYQRSPVDREQPGARPQTVSEALPASRQAGSEPIPSNAQASQRRIVLVAIVATLVLLAILGGAVAWKSFQSRSSAEAARIDEVCRAAAALVTAAISQADLSLAQAKSAAIPGHCSAHQQVSQARDNVRDAAERVASARSRVHALLDRGDVAEARSALGTLERIDRSASDLPELRRRLDRAQLKSAGSEQENADPAPAVLPQAPVRKDRPTNAVEPGRSGSSLPQRPPSNGAVAVRPPSAKPPVPKSQKCVDISMRAGLGEETAEERQYLLENCR